MSRVGPWFETGTGAYPSFLVYGTTKLANILFTQELARRLSGTRVTTHAFHPGFVRTNFGSSPEKSFMSALIGVVTRFALTPRQGADTGVFLIDEAAGGQTSGGYWAKRKPAAISGKANPVEGARLWAESEAVLSRSV